MKKLIPLFLFLIFINASFAVEITNFLAEVDLDQNIMSSTLIEMQFSEAEKNFEYFIYSKAENIRISDENDNRLACSVKAESLGNSISCQLQTGVKKIKINYDNQNVEIKDKIFIFSENYVFPYATGSAIIQVKLPEGFGLIEGGHNINSCTPSNCIKASDGRRVVILWNKKDILAGENIYVSSVYESVSKIETFSFLLYVIPILILGFILFFFVYKKKLSTISLIPILKEDEKKVMEAVLKYGSGVNQKIVVRETNYSKAKVSKVLKSLAERGIVKLERTGRSNKIFIEPKFEKKK